MDTRGKGVNENERALFFLSAFARRVIINQKYSV